MIFAKSWLSIWKRVYITLFAFDEYGVKAIETVTEETFAAHIHESGGGQRRMQAFRHLESSDVLNFPMIS
jgi:hypothetical protein